MSVSRNRAGIHEVRYSNDVDEPMPGLRDLTFFGVILGGCALVVTQLWWPTTAPEAKRYDTSAYQSVDHRFDELFHAEWKANQLQAAERADTLLIARRLALGLTGSVPSLEDIRTLERLPDAERVPWYLEHLLADRRSSEYLAERFARAFVGTEDGPFILYRRRRFTNWLTEEFQKNTPYDSMVRSILTDRGLWTDKPSTNFFSVTAQADAKNQPDPVRLAGRTTRAFLGLRLDCAECHNHPFASWKQTDFRGFAAFFGQTQIGFKGLQDGPGEYMIEDKVSKEMAAVSPAVPFAKELLPATGERRERLATWITHPENPYFARATVNRVWAILFGVPLVSSIDNLEPMDRSEALGDRVLQQLAKDFVTHGYDLRWLIRTIAMSRVYQADSKAAFEIGETHERNWAVYPLVRLRPEQVSGATLQASSVNTLNSQTHILIRLMKFGMENDFLRRYGDDGNSEFEEHGGTITQRLILMNGQLVTEKIKQNPLNSSTRIAWMAGDDAKAIEAAYLSILTRRPTPAELEHFLTFLKDGSLNRMQKLEDIYWSLVNSTEFAWGH
jgi:Protein of unknown function (DUF1553)/Protein of unknown function (DUF1549)